MIVARLLLERKDTFVGRLSAGSHSPLRSESTCQASEMTSGFIKSSHLLLATFPSCIDSSAPRQTAVDVSCLRRVIDTASLVIDLVMGVPPAQYHETAKQMCNVQLLQPNPSPAPGASFHPESREHRLEISGAVQALSPCRAGAWPQERLMLSAFHLCSMPSSQL